MFKILSLGPGARGFYELYLCRLYRAAQEDKPDLDKVYKRFTKDLRKNVSKELHRTIGFFLDMEFHPAIVKKLGNAVLKESHGEEFEMICIEGRREDVRDLNELSRKMGCPINIIEGDFTKYNYESSKYDMIMGGHILHLHTDFPFIEKMCELAPVMVFVEYEHEIKNMHLPKLKKYFKIKKATDQQLIKKAFDYFGDGNYQVTVEYGGSNDCLIKAKKT